MTSTRGNSGLDDDYPPLDCHFSEDSDEAQEHRLSQPDNRSFADDVSLYQYDRSTRTLLERSDSSATILTDEEEQEDFMADFNDIDAHVCLSDLTATNSDLEFIHRRLPIPEDPGIIPAFWILFPKPRAYPDDGVDKFTDLMTALKLPPIQKVSKMLTTDEINLRYYGVDPRAVRAICEATFHNKTVKTLNLAENCLTVDACFHLNDLLVINQVLTTLDLSGCRIGPRGAKRLQEGIGAAPCLQVLRVSRCNLGDEGLQFVCIGVYCSRSLLSVDLSDNKVGEGSGAALQTMLTQTDTLNELNLSWNSLSSEDFWVKFIDGLDRNLTLTDLDLSWNNLGEDCVPSLVRFLSSSSALRTINLQDNNFGGAEAKEIADGLRKNLTLERIYLGNNRIGAEGIFEFLKIVLLNASPNSQLRLLDLTNIWANKSSVPILERLKFTRPELEIKLGGILSNYKLIGPDARKIFLQRANFEAMKPKKKRKRKNFGQFVLSLDDLIVSKETFRKSVKMHKLQLRKSLIEEIMNAFEISDDMINQGALKSFYMKEYPDTQPSKLKPKKPRKKTAPKQQTKSIKKIP